MTSPRPCPVCGGTTFSIEAEEIGRGMVIACLVCDGCDMFHHTHGPLSDPCDTEEEAEEAAILAWNCVAWNCVASSRR